MSLEKLLSEYNHWAKNKFPNSTPTSSLRGLEREIKEVEIELETKNPDFIKLGMEYADCMMYLIDSARRSGINEDTLFSFLRIKLDINYKRDWKINEDNSYSHIKENLLPDRL